MRYWHAVLRRERRGQFPPLGRHFSGPNFVNLNPAFGEVSPSE